MSTVVLFNKPFRVLCQFSPSEGKSTLADYIDIPDVYAAGRLDYDSEGLLVLTDDGELQARLSNPKFRLGKRYLAQVENIPRVESLTNLAQGIQLKDGMTLPAKVNKFDQPEWLWPREPPIRQRRDIPTQWLELEIFQGKNRQVRRMTAAIGHPTLRLIRTHIGEWSIAGLQPGEYRQISV